MGEHYHHGGRSMYSNTDECYDGGSRRVYSHTDTDECYDDVDRRRPAAYADDCYNGGGGYGGEQEYYKREEKQHKNRERLGEVGALAGGAFALYEGHRAKVDPEHAQKHRIEQGVAGVAALGAGGYAYHEHREHKETTRYEGGREHNNRVPHGYCTD